MKEKKDKPKRGRPVWEPPDLKIVKELAKRGLTEKQIADALGIHVDTLRARKNDYSGFSDAIKKGRAEGIAAMANVITSQAMSGNLTAAIFYMKCRGGWREKDDMPTDEPRKIAADIRIALAEIDEKTGGND